MQPYNLEYSGIHKNKDLEVQLFVYDDLNLTEYEDFNVSDLDNYIDKQKINWINIHGLNNVEWLKSIGNYFEIDNFMFLRWESLFGENFDTENFTEDEILL